MPYKTRAEIWAEFACAAIKAEPSCVNDEDDGFDHRFLAENAANAADYLLKEFDRRFIFGFSDEAYDSNDRATWHERKKK